MARSLSKGLMKTAGKSVKKSSALLLWSKPLLFLGAYALWLAFFNMIGLTLVTFVLNLEKPVSFEEINDFMNANAIPLLGFASCSFLLLFRSLITPRRLGGLAPFTASGLRRRLLPGVAQGVLVALGLAATLLITQQYQYLGFFLQSDEIGWAAAKILFHALMIALWVCSEEFLFREWLYRRLVISQSFWKRLGVCFMLSLIFMLFKSWQLDLEWAFMTHASLLLLSLSFYLHRGLNKDFGWNAGYATGLFVAIQAIFSMPLLHHGFQGLIALQPKEGALSSFLISGGDAGPLAGFAFQLVLLLDIIRCLLKTKQRTPSP